MRHRSLILLPVSCVILAPLPAMAQMEPPAGCAARVAPPAGMASWSKPQGMSAARDEPGLAGAALAPGQAVVVKLVPAADLHYPAPPAKTGGSGGYGGLVSILIDRPGTWRVALGSGAWVDMVKEGDVAESIAHGHGPDCTGIRKMVDYRLEPGRYILQLAASADPEVTLLVTRLP